MGVGVGVGRGGAGWGWGVGGEGGHPQPPFRGMLTESHNYRVELRHTLAHQPPRHNEL